MIFPRVGPAGFERPPALDADGVAHDLTQRAAGIDGVFPSGNGRDVAEADIDRPGRRRHVLGRA
ncbi:hypothetical protein [Actinacidiphila glaucinigra]|uniref:hypothetical protein n=1 Tax=Actinacidiphila glaucinigra TaxID=235986 RepID=UPI0029B0F00D|nr:hypothetical protein [Streptomyces sp. PA03-3a]